MLSSKFFGSHYFFSSILFVSSALAFIFLSSSFVSADDSAVDVVKIKVPVSCSLTGTGMNTHTATINNGQYNSAIGTTTLKAFCNDDEGFAIYAIGYTDNEDGKNVLTDHNISNTNDIVTGTAISGDTSNWAMKLIATSGTYAPIIAGSSTDTMKAQGDPDFSTFQAVPSDYAKVAYRLSSTDLGTNAEGSVLTTTYQTYISPTQSAGTYNGQVKYTLVHPNDADVPFDCNPNATTISEVKCMQDFASLSSANKTSVLNSMILEQQYTLTDKRDKKEYKVAKLADGKVWMTQNLDLDLDSDVTYTNLDTDLGWNGTSYDEASWTPIRSTYETASNGIHEWCSGGTFDSTYRRCRENDTPESYDPGDIYWDGVVSNYPSSDWSAFSQSCDYSVNPNSCNDLIYPLGAHTTNAGNSIPQYHLGNYYNWAAAIAANDASDFGAHGDYNEKANQSICPAGWTLPHSAENDTTLAPEGDFYNLWLTYGWIRDEGGEYSDYPSTLHLAPLYFTLSGIFGDRNGSSTYVRDVGGKGFFAASVINWTNIFPGEVGGTWGEVDVTMIVPYANGLSVRCLLR